MRKPITLAAVCVPLLLAGFAAAHDAKYEVQKFAFGEPGKPGEPSRTIEIKLGEMYFDPNRFDIRAGEQIRFVLTNVGTEDHEFVLGRESDIKEHALEMKKHPGMTHTDPHSMRVEIYGARELVWRFTRTGEFKFACLIGTHFEHGMVGNIVVK